MLDVQEPKTIIHNGVVYDCTHGSPFDRGSADSWYGRIPLAHRGGVGGDSGPRIDDLTTEEIGAYHAGYTYNEQHGGKKNYL